MAILRATVVHNMVSGNSEDRAVNVWHWETNSDTDASAVVAGEIIGDALHGFYRNLGSYLSGRILRTASAHTTTIARVVPGSAGADDDVVSRVIHTVDSAAGYTAATVATNLPPEIACALSFQGDIAGFPEKSGQTRPAARRRGRVFVGPFNTSVLEATLEPLFKLVFIQAVRTGYATMIAAATSAGDIYQARHVIYSPTSATVHEVKKIWVDNAPDIIRRRGVVPTAREEYDVTQPVDA